MRYDRARGAAVALAMGVLVVSAAPGAGPAGASEDTVLQAGDLKVAGRTMRCGRTPTLLSNTFWDYGGASKGLIILNPQKLATLPRAVRLYVYAHECGHQIYGANEPTADCYAVQRGRREGWLTAKGLDEVCHFLKDLPGDYVHPPGPVRCAQVRQCFDEARPQRASR